MPDPEADRKLRALNIFQLIFMMLAPLLGLFYFYVGAVSLFHITIVAGLLMIPSLLLLRKTQNIVLISNYCILVLWATLFVLSWNTGAMSSEGVITPSLILNGGLILLAVFFNGLLRALGWAILILLQTLVLAYLFRSGYTFPNLIPHDSAPLYALGAYLTGFLFLLILAYLFEREKIEAQSGEQEKSRALEVSRRDLDDILARSPIPTFTLGKDHRVTLWNNACQEMTGITAEEILGKEVWEGFRMEEQGSLADILLEDPDFIAERCGCSLVPGTETEWFELEMVLPKLKGGIRVLTGVAPILDGKGRVNGAIQTVQAVSTGQDDRGMAHSEPLGGIEETWTNPVFRVDSQGKISFWNRASEDSFGFSASKMLGKSPLSLVAKRFRPSFKKTIVGVLRGKSYGDRQWKYYNKQGEPLYVLARVYPWQNSDKQEKECIIVNTNITDLKLKMKELEAEASETKEELKNLSDEYQMLRKNIASFLRGKEKIEW